MSITVDLKEGMEIKEIYNDNSENYTLVKSTQDNELYGVGRTKVIKISDINESDYICENLNSFDKMETYFEFENNYNDKTKLIEMDESLIYELAYKIDENTYEDSEFSSINVRKVYMTIEEFINKTKDQRLKFLRLRGKVKSIYDKKN